jgi:hypothetical protein
MKSNLEAMNSSQGGDVMGTFKIDISQGKSVEAAKASIDPGYSLESTFEAGYVDQACLVRGYCDYGVAIGQDSPVGGKKIG